MDLTRDTRTALAVMAKTGLGSKAQVAGQTIDCIFRTPSESAAMASFDVTASQYTLRALSDDVAAVKAGDNVTVGNRTYQVVRIDPEDGGLTTLWLGAY